MTLPDRIILTGFMGTGKTSVGRVLAEKLRLPFIDTDVLVEERAEKPIFQIFTEDGETAFRRLESEALDQALAKGPAVIAVGGGAVCFPGNFIKLKKAGSLVLLSASVPTILERTADEFHRPLLPAEDREASIYELLEKRAKDYARITLQVETDRKSVKKVADEVLELLSLSSGVLTVRLREKAYPIYFQEEGHRYLPDLLEKHAPAPRVVLISNPTVFRLHGRRFQKVLEKRFSVHKILIPDGERYKNFKTLGTLYARLAQAKVDRKTPLIALGGGVIGDVAGFAAASFLRGIPLIQIPTTLLAQVDSSIGGKTGIDLPQGKNLVGAFYQPRFVLIDEASLATLPKRQLACGLAEVIKYAAIFDAPLFRRLEKAMPSILKNVGDGLMPVVRRCCEWKAWVVEKDEFDTLDIRAQLNFGHTLGHAIEALTHYQRYTHGEAIAMGMVFAAQKSMAVAGLKPREAKRLSALIASAGLPTDLPHFSKQAYRNALAQDKKRVSSLLHFVYLKKIGKAAVIPTSLDKIL